MGAIISLSTITSCSTDRSSSSLSSSSTDRFSFWSDEEKALMDLYCGGSLPYDASYMSDNVEMKEVEEPGQTYSYLEIKDYGVSFSLRSYHELLSTYGWTPISTVKEGVYQTSQEDIEFVECTRIVEGESVAYDMIYYYVESNEEEEGYNLIKCYANLRGDSSSATDWTKSEKETFFNTIGVELPYISLGRGYSISQYTYTNPLDPTVIQIVDTYASDLTLTYTQKLRDEGFSYDAVKSYSQNARCLSKKFADGATLSVYLYYYGGNAFEFIYMPKEEEHSSWPSEISTLVKEKADIVLPEFSVAEGGHYYSYHKGNVYCVYTTDYDETFDYVEYYENQIGFVGFAWNEKAEFKGAFFTDADQNPVGFGLLISLKEPTSTFVDSFPSDKVNEVVTSLLGISGVNIPSFPSDKIPASDKKVKYQVFGEETYEEYYEYYYNIILEYKDFYVDELGENPTEEDIAALAKEYAYREEGIDIHIYDKDQQAYLSYEETIYQRGWYGGRDAYNNIVYEDPQGKIAITLGEPEVAPTHDNCGETVISIRPGSGESHTPKMFFSKETLEVAIGDSINLNDYLVLNMLPYEPSFSSSDTSGKISVDKDGILTLSSETENGAEALIRATVTVPVPGENHTYTADIKIVAVKPYDSSEIIDDIASIITKKGYTPKVSHDVNEYGWSEDYLNLEFDSTWTLDSIKEFVIDNLILEGTTKKDDEGWSDWEEEAINVYPEEKAYAGCYITYYWDDVYNVSIDYQIYEKDGKLCLQVFAI